MRYVPSVGRVIVKQIRESKSASGLLYVPEEAQVKGIAEVVAVAPGEDDIKIGDKVYFDFASGSVISDKDGVVFTVLDIEDILAYCYDEDEVNE